MISKGPLCVFCCYLLWGIIPIFWSALTAVDAFYLLATRIVWSLLLMAAVLVFRKSSSAVRAVMANKKEFIRLTIAGMVICINWGIYIWTVNNGYRLDASLAYYMVPTLNIFLGTILFRERLTMLQWLSVAVTLAGLVVVMFRSGQFPWLALSIGGTFAVYGAIKKDAQTTDVGVSLFFETLILAPLMLIFVVAAELRGTGAVGVVHGAQWLLLPATGVVSTVPLLLFSMGIKSTSMTLAGILMYVNPTLQLLVSVCLYHETFTTDHAILFCFVWGGVALYMLSSWLKERRKDARLCA